ncbi:uncharacterized protein LOC141895310 isoform X2 [Acropora palmata]|uniref:uncharacterized protein LOC141895310 isoform X2 n=1 Tax=Acropora palmata TaxID=6131 RepID=UPI003D9FF54A
MDQIGFRCLILFLWATSAIEGAIKLANVKCDKPLPTTVAVDFPQHRYYPYFVRLHRCQGSVNRDSPNIVECVATTYMERKVKVFSTKTRERSEVIVRNHTSCGSVCKANPKECRDGVQQWNLETCSCECLYSDRDPPQKRDGFRWNRQTCSYKCSGIRRCPAKKVWNKEECSCVCSSFSNMTCSLLDQIMDHTTCECKDRTQPQHEKAPGFFANGSTVVLVALLVIALCVIGLLSGLLCSRCKASSRSMKSAESQTTTCNRQQSQILYESAV